MELCWSGFVLVAAVFAFFTGYGVAEEDLPKEKIAHAILNHNDLAVVKVGTNGVTSLEFPYKIEAIDGYGFSATPGTADAFQLTYTKGANYFSVRALKPGASGNLTVVLDQKVYSILFRESSDPSFVDIFELPAENGPTQAVTEKEQPATLTQIAGLLDVVKNYGALRTTHPEVLDGLRVVESGKKVTLGNGIESTIRRVLEDDSIGAAAFEVEIDNRSNDDFTYDPRSLEIKGKQQTYDAATEDGTGTVKAGSSGTLYLAVNLSGTGQQNGLIGDDLQLTVKASPKNEPITFDQPTSSYLPTAMTTQKLPDFSDSSVVQDRRVYPDSKPDVTTTKHATPKKVFKKSETSPKNAKESLAEPSKPERKKLFGWL